MAEDPKVTPSGSGSGSDSGSGELSIKPSAGTGAEAKPAPAGDVKPAAKPVAPAAPAESTAKPAATSSPAPSPTPAPVAKPTAPAAAPKTPEKKESGTFQNIFGQKKEKADDSKMVESILSKQTAKKAKPILGAAPEMQKSIAQQKSIVQKKRLRNIQTIFAFVVLAFGGMAFYFYQALAPGFDLFGQNITLQLKTVNDNLAQLQTQLNKYRLLTAQLNLNAFSFSADEFLDKTEQLSVGGLTGPESQALAADISQLNRDLTDIFGAIRQNLTAPFVIETVRSEAEEEITEAEKRSQYENELRKLLRTDADKIVASEDLSDENLQDLKLIENTLKLVGNKKLEATVKSETQEGLAENLANYVENFDPEIGEQIRGFMSGVLASTKSDVATIGFIKSQRIEWSQIIDQINEVTIEVDDTFGNTESCVLTFCIIYTGYDFDTSANKIILSGFVKTANEADNFTKIAELIDALEGSRYFQAVEMRSFNKGGSFTEGFTANFKIDLALEESAAASLEETAEIVSRAIANKSGVKRTASVKRAVTGVKRAQ